MATGTGCRINAAAIALPIAMKTGQTRANQGTGGHDGRTSGGKGNSGRTLVSGVAVNENGPQSIQDHGPSSQRVMGLEPTPNLADSTEKPHLRAAGGATAALPYSLSVPADPELRAIVEAWDDLPQAVKAGILAMVKATQSYT